MWGCKLSPGHKHDADSALRRRARLGRAYHAVFGSPEGKLVLADLLGAAGMLETSHMPGDSCGTAFQEGRRSLGLHVLDHLRWTETELLRLARERTSDRLIDTEQEGA